LLTAPQNHEEWPEVVSIDLQKHVSDLQSQLQVVTSLVKGKILLPYPKYNGTTATNGVSTHTNGHARSIETSQPSSRKYESFVFNSI
jgi:hypothetical protein